MDNLITEDQEFVLPLEIQLSELPDLIAGGLREESAVHVAMLRFRICRNATFQR
jgi:hypothetical protein